MVTTRLVGVIVVAWAVLSGFTHPTEQFIPIGKSPGLSKEGLTVIGVVGDVNLTKRTVVIGCTEVQLSQDTIVYLDRTIIQQPNTVGDWGDIMIDEVVEAYPPAWIKVRRE